jgi:hypothetical protein
VCRGTSYGLHHQGQADHRYRTLETQYTNCTFIDGNLELTFLDAQDDYDLSFLSTIREVGGVREGVCDCEGDGIRSLVFQGICREPRATTGIQLRRGSERCPKNDVIHLIHCKGDGVRVVLQSA